MLASGSLPLRPLPHPWPELPLDRPFQVDGGGPGGVQPRAVPDERRHEGIGRRARRVQCGEVHAVARRRADQPGAAQVHVGDRDRHLFDRGQILDDEAMGQVALIDDLDDARIVLFEPDGAVVVAVCEHRAIPDQSILGSSASQMRFSFEVEASMAFNAMIT